LDFRNTAFFSIHSKSNSAHNFPTGTRKIVTPWQLSWADFQIQRRFLNQNFAKTCTAD
jgi:hypothetical protein